MEDFSNSLQKSVCRGLVCVRRTRWGYQAVSAPNQQTRQIQKHSNSLSCFQLLLGRRRWENTKTRKYCQLEIHLPSKQSLFNSPLIHRFLYWIMARAPSQVKVDTLAYAWTAAPIENQAILLLSKNTLLNVRYTVIWLHKKSQCSKLVVLRQIFVSSHLVCGSFFLHTDVQSFADYHMSGRKMCTMCMPKILTSFPSFSLY